MKLQLWRDQISICGRCQLKANNVLAGCARSVLRLFIKLVGRTVFGVIALRLSRAPSMSSGTAAVADPSVKKTGKAKRDGDKNEIIDFFMSVGYGETKAKR